MTGASASLIAGPLSHFVGQPLEDLAVEMLARGLSLRDIAPFRPITPDRAASNVYLVEVQDFTSVNSRKFKIDPQRLVIFEAGSWHELPFTPVRSPGVV